MLIRLYFLCLIALQDLLLHWSNAPQLQNPVTTKMMLLMILNTSGPCTENSITHNLTPSSYLHCYCQTSKGSTQIFREHNLHLGAPGELGDSNRETVAWLSLICTWCPSSVSVVYGKGQELRLPSFCNSPQHPGTAGFCWGGQGGDRFVSAFLMHSVTWSWQGYRQGRNWGYEVAPAC